MESKSSNKPIARARESGSHEDTTLSTIRHSSTSVGSVLSETSVSVQECVALRQKVDRLEQVVEELQNIITTLEEENYGLKNNTTELTDIIQSLESNISSCMAESELHRLESQKHRNELCVFVRLFNERKKQIDEEHREELDCLQEKLTIERRKDLNCLQEKLTMKHQEELNCLQEKVEALVAESFHTSRRHLRYCQHNEQLCQLVDSQNIYLSEIETRFTEILHERSDEVGKLRDKYDLSLKTIQSLKASNDAREMDARVFKEGINRAADFLTELGSRGFDS